MGISEQNNVYFKSKQDALMALIQTACEPEYEGALDFIEVDEDINKMYNQAVFNIAVMGITPYSVHSSEYMVDDIFLQLQAIVIDLDIDDLGKSSLISGIQWTNVGFATSLENKDYKKECLEKLKRARFFYPKISVVDIIRADTKEKSDFTNMEFNYLSSLNLSHCEVKNLEINQDIIAKKINEAVECAKEMEKEIRRESKNEIKGKKDIRETYDLIETAREVLGTNKTFLANGIMGIQPNIEGIKLEKERIKEKINKLNEELDDFCPKIGEDRNRNK